jgi:hypothetical protein
VDNNADAGTTIYIDSGVTTGQASELRFQDRGINKWILGKSNTNVLYLHDPVESNSPLEIHSHADNASMLYIKNGLLGVGVVPTLAKLHVAGGGLFTGDLEVNGTISQDGTPVKDFDITTVAITSSLAVSDGPMIDITAGGITITLPPVASARTGQLYYLKDSDGNAAADSITIEGDDAETIDDNLNFILTTDHQSVTVLNLGDKWIIV